VAESVQTSDAAEVERLRAELDRINRKMPRIAQHLTEVMALTEQVAQASYQRGYARGKKAALTERVQTAYAEGVREAQQSLVNWTPRHMNDARLREARREEAEYQQLFRRACAGAPR